MTFVTDFSKSQEVKWCLLVMLWILSEVWDNYFSFTFILCMSVLTAYICTPHVCLVSRKTKIECQGIQELELQMIVSLWVLGAKAQFSARLANAPNLWGISSALSLLFNFSSLSGNSTIYSVVWRRSKLITLTELIVVIRWNNVGKVTIQRLCYPRFPEA